MTAVSCCRMAYLDRGRIAEAFGGYISKVKGKHKQNAVNNNTERREGSKWDKEENRNVVNRTRIVPHSELCMQNETILDYWAPSGIDISTMSWHKGILTWVSSRYLH